MRPWTWASASCIGVAHLREGSRKQDAVRTFSIVGASEVFVSIVCDGAGSATHGGEGASLTCNFFARAIRNHLKSSGALPAQADFTNWLGEARDHLSFVAKKRSLELRDFASTLVVAVSDGTSIVAAHVGDGAIVVRNAHTSEWRVASWPANGEYAAMTYFVTSDDEPPMRFFDCSQPVSAIFVFSDGIERLALNFGEQTPHKAFFDAMVKPFDSASTAGKSETLSASLLAFLDSDKVRDRTDDDKTIVIAVR
jgi:hypothetical protein